MIVARTQPELGLVNGAIHDGWFSVNDLEFDRSRGQLRVRFTHDESIDFRSICSLKDRRAGVLVIHHVTSWELKDEQHLVWYDFNRLRYRASAGRLEVLTNIPLLLRVEVTALEVEVQPSGESGKPEPCLPL